MRRRRRNNIDQVDCLALQHFIKILVNRLEPIIARKLFRCRPGSITDCDQFNQTGLRHALPTVVMKLAEKTGASNRNTNF